MEPFGLDGGIIKFFYKTPSPVEEDETDLASAEELCSQAEKCYEGGDKEQAVKLWSIAADRG